jgi:hypothetical protein
MKNSIQPNYLGKMPKYSAQLLWLFIFGLSILNGYSQTTTCPSTALVGTGNGGDGKLGIGSSPNLSRFTLYGIGTDWKQIAVGIHSVAVKPDGSLWGWGFNRSGALGIPITGGTAVVSSPVQLDSVKNWKQVTSMADVSAAVKTDGSLWAWGGISLSTGQSFHPYYTPNTSSPVQIGADKDWKQVKDFHGLKTDGSLWRWGGYVSSANDPNRSIAQMGTAKDWKEIQGGYVLKNDGSLWTVDSLKQIGTDKDWKQVDGSPYSHTLAIKNDGSLWTWGNNDYGQLGDGTTGSRTNPVRIGTANDWMEVSAGGLHSTALKTNGSLWVWGANYTGQLGDGTLTNKSVPTTIVGLIGTYLHLYAGGELTIASICVTPLTLDPNQCYRIKSDYSGKVLEVQGASQVNGVQIYQWTYTGKPHQLWKFVKLPDGLYNIISVNSGKYIDVAKNAPTGLCVDGVITEQANPDGSDSQKWRIELQADGLLKIINVACNKTLRVEFGRTTDGSNIGIQNEGFYDKWLIEKVACPSTCNLTPSVSGSNSVNIGATTNLTGSATTGTVVWSSSDITVATVSATGVVKGVKAGTVTISYKITEGSCTATATKTITVNAAACNLTPSVSGSNSVNIGATISLTGSTTTGTALWSSSDIIIATVSATGVVTGLKAGTVTISYKITEGTCTATATKTITVNGTTPPSNFDPTKCYTLTARHSGKVMEIAAQSTDNGIPIQQGTWGYSRRQVWRIKSVDGTYYNLTNALSGKMLDVKGGYQSDGTILQQFQSNGGDNQKWRFDKNTEGYYFITSKNSGKVIDVKGVSLLDGTRIQQSTKNGGYNQQWTVAQVGCPVGTVASQSAQIYAADGYRDGHKGILTWVSNAANADYFSVEKQNKNGDFETLENINAKSAATYSDKNYYSYTDNQAVDGENIYRIGLVADNTPPQYSNLISLNFKTVMDFSIFPNPTSDYVDVDLTTYENRPVTLTLIDASGHEMQRLSVEKAGKTQRIVLDDLTNGLYLVRIQTVGKRDVTRVFNLTK